jgi:heme/copper-type cytochrome/quinol oxidase subunit 3
MKTWVPITIALVLTFVMNAFPLFMAFVVEDEGWAQAGWVFYFYTIPLGILLILLGALISIILFFRRRRKPVK